jgi:TorA maturation chaperone TorD
MDDLSGEYSRLFLGAGLVPLREGGYGGGSRFAGQPIDIADINGFYLAFGFDLTDQAPVPSDHIGAELEFVSLLLLKKALAVKRGAQREASMIDRAMRLFFDDHLGRWPVALDMALKEAKAAAPYATMAELLRKAVAAGCAYLHIRPQVGPLAAGRSPIRDQMVEDTLVCPLAVVEQARGL